MYTRILVPLDGSPRAERSVPVAAALARATQGSVVLVHVLRVVGAFGPLEPAAYNMTVLEEERRDAVAYLTEVAGRPVLSGIATEVGVFTGAATLSILDAVTAYKADTIVITSHGRTGLSRWALGSVAEHVIRHASVPVVVLREQGSSPAERMPAGAHTPRVLVPVDGSVLAEAILDPAVEMAQALAAPLSGVLYLVLVASASEAIPAHTQDDAAVAAANEYLASIATKVRAQHRDVSVTWESVLNTDPASGVLHVAEHADNTGNSDDVGGYDLIAMATHGRSGLARWMFGSITERVLHATQLPMLIVRPGPMEEKEYVNDKVVTQEPVGLDVPTVPAFSALF